MVRPLRVLFLCVFISMLGLGIIDPVIPLYAESLGIAFAQIGLLVSAWSFSRLVFAAPMGRLSDRANKKWIIAAGLTIYTLVSALYTLAWDFPSLVSIRFLHGLGSVMATPIALAYAVEVAPEGEEGKTLGTMNFAMLSGWGLGPFVGGFLSDAFSLRFVFQVMGAVSSLSLLVALFFLPRDAGRPAAVRGRPSFRSLLRNRLVRAAVVYRVIASLGRGGLTGFLALFVSGPIAAGGLGLPVSAAGLILSASVLFMALLQHPFGLLADRHSKVRLIILGGVIGAIGYSLVPSANGFWAVLAAVLLISLGGSMVIPSITALVAAEGRGVGIGTTMSVLDSSISAGMIAGPLMSGIIVEVSGLRMVFYAASSILVGGTAAFYALQRSR